MKRLIELITGQNNLNYVQNKVSGGLISELCRFCEEEDETFEHLLNGCPSFTTYRREILENKVKTLDRKATSILQFANISAIDEALQYPGWD